MQLATEKDLKRLKINIIVILSVMVTIIALFVIHFFETTKHIWEYPGISNIVKFRIACDQQWGIDRVYTIEKGEKFIISVFGMGICGESNSIFDQKGYMIVRMNKEHSNGEKIEIIPAEKSNSPSKWCVKGDTKEDDILITHNANGEYEVKYLRYEKDPVNPVKKRNKGNYE